MFLSEVFQLRNEFSDMGEVVSNKRLTSTILDALPEEKHSTIKVHAIKDSEATEEHKMAKTCDEVD